VSPLAWPFLTSLLVASAATLLCERIARRVGLVVQPRADRWHRQAVPLLGGVAIVVGVLPGLAWIGGHRGLTALVGVSLATAAVGLFDDVRPLRPPVKLVLQIALAVVLVHLGFALRLTAVPALNLLITVFWIVGVTNAFNLLDNMDGLAAGMAAIVAAFRLTFFVLDGNPAGAALTAAFLGSLAGFLARNLPPAKIFMGDAGSLFIGFFLSGLSFVADATYSRGVAAVLVLPVLLVLVPIFDTTFVTVTRLLTGRPVSQGGRDHTSHRLVALGISERRALAFLYGTACASGLVAVLTYRYGITYTVVLLALLVVALVLLGVHLSRVQVARQTAGRPDASTDGLIVRLVAEFPFKRHVATVLLDLVLIVVAYYAAYLLRFEEAFEANRDAFVRTIGPVVLIQLSALAYFGAYRGLWRYTSVPDLLRLLRGTTVGVAASVVFFVFTTRFEDLSRAVFVLDWMLLVLFVAGSRVSFRLLGEALRGRRSESRRVVIYGAGDGGELMLRELRNNPDLRREPVGFVDDDREKAGARIHGVPVLGGLDALDDLLARFEVAEVVVSSRKIPGERLRRLEAVCAGRGVTVVRGTVQME
jgi:UDP-GlcNAc:undecaprenyl-phosphate GlcNAc-1-phosphate transferase